MLACFTSKMNDPMKLLAVKLSGVNDLFNMYSITLVLECDCRGYGMHHLQLQTKFQLESEMLVDMGVPQYYHHEMMLFSTIGL